jgi:hypothetical protein
MSDENKEVTMQAKGALPALPDANTIREIFESNFEGITPSFEVVKMPAGGATFWSVPAEDGEDAEKELVGIVLDHYSARAYWPAKIGPGSTVPPMCSSLDAKVGSLPRNKDGEFGDCATCKWAQFGTAKNDDGSPGRGQACQFKHRVFLLMPERGIFPYMVGLSATSASKKYEGSFSTYAVKLSSKLKRIGDVKTKIKLKGETNADNKPYALALFFQAGDLTEEEKKMSAFLREKLKSAMRQKPFDMEEAAEAEPQTNGSAPTYREPDPWEKRP